MRFLSLAGLAGALIVGIACGGKVVVDGGGGSGGMGSTTTTTTNVTGTSSSNTVSASSTLSTSSGPSCSCDSFCTVIQSCGFGGVECASFCDGTNPQVMQCACDNQANCDAVSQCFSGPGVGSTGVGGSGGGSGAPTLECWNCVTDGSLCQNESIVCGDNPDCAAIIECHESLGWTYEAVGQCDPIFPGGYNDYYAYVSCLVCQSCFDPCATSSLATYCFDG